MASYYAEHLLEADKKVGIDVGVYSVVFSLEFHLVNFSLIVSHINGVLFLQQLLKV
jgi:hypothetical protein